MSILFDKLVESVLMLSAFTAVLIIGLIWLQYRRVQQQKVDYLVGNLAGRFERYRIRRRMSRGWYADVYDAFDEVDYTRVAVRVMNPTAAMDPLLVEEMRAEARLLTEVAERVRLDGVVRCLRHDVDKPSGRPFTVLELAGGRSLAELLAKGYRPTLLECAAILRPVAEALDVAAELGRPHRCLRPEKIMVQRVWLDIDRACLTDFSPGKHEYLNPNTMDAGATGELAYLAPELRRGDWHGARGDVYALGAIIFQMITGAVPFRSVQGDPGEMKLLHETAPVPGLPESLPAVVRDAVRQSLAKEGRQRPATCMALVEALEEGGRELLAHRVDHPLTDAVEPRPAAVEAVAPRTAPVPQPGWMPLRPAAAAGPAARTARPVTPLSRPLTAALGPPRPRPLEVGGRARAAEESRRPFELAPRAVSRTAERGASALAHLDRLPPAGISRLDLRPAADAATAEPRPLLGSPLTEPATAALPARAATARPRPARLDAGPPLTIAAAAGSLLVIPPPLELPAELTEVGRAAAETDLLLGRLEMVAASAGRLAGGPVAAPARLAAMPLTWWPSGRPPRMSPVPAAEAAAHKPSPARIGGSSLEPANDRPLPARPGARGPLAAEPTGAALTPRPTLSPRPERPIEVPTAPAAGVTGPPTAPAPDAPASRTWRLTSGGPEPAPTRTAALPAAAARAATPSPADATIEFTPTAAGPRPAAGEAMRAPAVQAAKARALRPEPSSIAPTYTPGVAPGPVGAGGTIGGSRPSPATVAGPCRSPRPASAAPAARLAAAAAGPWSAARRAAAGLASRLPLGPVAARDNGVALLSTPVLIEPAGANGFPLKLAPLAPLAADMARPQTPFVPEPPAVGEPQVAVPLIEGPDPRELDWHIGAQLVLSVPVVPSALRAVAFSPDGARLAVIGRDTIPAIWDADAGRELGRLGDEGRDANCVAWSPDGRWIAVGVKSRVLLWSVDRGAWHRELIGHRPNRPVRAVAFLGDDDVLSAGDDADVLRWDVLTGEQRATYEGHDRTIWCIAPTPDGEGFYTASADCTVRSWKVDRPEAEYALRAHSQGLISVAVSADGRRLATTSKRGTAKLWDLEAKRIQALLPGHGDRVVSADFSPDGRWLATGCLDQRVRVWEAETGLPVVRFKVSQIACRDARWNPDGRTLATVWADGGLRLWAPRQVVDEAALSAAS